MPSLSPFGASLDPAQSFSTSASGGAVVWSVPDRADLHDALAKIWQLSEHRRHRIQHGPDKLDEHFACGSRMSRFLYGDQAVSASTGMTAEATWKRASIASLLQPNC
jgi:hypothetical protein